MAQEKPEVGHLRPPARNRVKPKSHLKLIKKYMFSEGEQFPPSENKYILLVLNRISA